MDTKHPSDEGPLWTDAPIFPAMEEYGRKLYLARVRAGRAVINERRTPGEDVETLATDVFADVLTALYGPAMSNVPLDAARRLLERAFRSYTGDAEDYS